MNRKSQFILLLWLCLSFGLYAQEGSLVETAHPVGTDEPVNDDLIRIGKKKALARKYFDNGDYLSAIHYYKQAYEFKPRPKIAEKIAYASFLVRDYEAARQWYEELFNLEPEKYLLARYYYAYSLKSLGDYEAALAEFKNFIIAIPEGEYEALKARANIDAQGCLLAKELMQQPDPNAYIENIGAGINTPYTELSPAVFNDTALLFTTFAPDTLPVDENLYRYLHHSRIFRARLTHGIWQKTGALAANINQTGYQNGSPFFDNQTNTLYFVRCKDDGAGFTGCKIYKAKWQGNSWTDIQALNDSINKLPYMNTNPAVVYAGDERWLCFASNRPGGVGGFDLWYAKINDDGSLDNPVNMGEKVNTAGNEITPFFSRSQGRLYYSSDGYPSMGGYDVFFTALDENNQWGKVTNAGVPVNSSLDDFYYVLKDDQTRGYVVSNRPGPYSLKSPTCCDDIYEIKYKIIYAYATGKVYEDMGFGKRQVRKFDVKLINASNDSLVAQQLEKKDNQFAFYFRVRGDYRIVISKNGYKEKSISLGYDLLEKKDSIFLPDVFLERLDLSAGAIFSTIPFDYENPSCDLTVQKTLDSLTTFLYENPGLNVEIAGFVADRGDEEQNLKLSEKGAKLVYDFFIREKIPGERLSYKGYGTQYAIAGENAKPGDFIRFRVYRSESP